MHHNSVDFIDCVLIVSPPPPLTHTPHCRSLGLSASLPPLFFLTQPPDSFSFNLPLVSPLSRGSVMGDHSLGVSGENIVDPGHQ